jgi:hypothetical protein
MDDVIAAMLEFGELRDHLFNVMVIIKQFLKQPRCLQKVAGSGLEMVEELDLDGHE